MANENIKLFRLEEEEDDYGYWLCNQEVYDGDKLVYDVCNLNDCPEDAVIERSLLSAYEWLGVVKYGMRLAALGYTDVAFEGEDNG